MRKFRFLLVVGCFGLLLSLVPSVARALPRCSVACTPSASCSTQCVAIGGGSPEITTCGEWGICSGFASVFTAESSTRVEFSAILSPTEHALGRDAEIAKAAAPAAESR